MEKLELTVLSKDQVIAYRDNNSFVRYEPFILDEILKAVEAANVEILTWFNGFGDNFRSIIMNVHAYRMGLDFGFTEISFDRYGWLTRPQFLNVESLQFGNTARYGEYSTLTTGMGPNNSWTNALNYNFGTAGGGSALSVFGKHFSSKEDAILEGVNKLKVMMLDKVGDKDRSNFNPQVIRCTLNAIAEHEIARVQLTLF